jgi:hypothetical protein
MKLRLLLGSREQLEFNVQLHCIVLSRISRHGQNMFLVFNQIIVQLSNSRNARAHNTSMLRDSIP